MPEQESEFWKDRTQGPAVKPFSEGFLWDIFQHYMPGVSIGRNEDGSTFFNRDLSQGDNGLRPYDGPMRQDQRMNPVTSGAYEDALGQAKGENPYTNLGRNYATNQLGGGNSELANMAMTYMLGGPLAGASRAQGLEMMQGNTPRHAEQRMMNSISGIASNRAADNQYNMLGQDRQLSRMGAFDTQYGQGAQSARGQQNDVIQGRNLNGNPWLDSTFNRASNAVVDKYRDATQPGIAAQFARAGSFGGSAHQQNEAIARYGLGRNLEELGANIYGQNYQEERNRQEQAAARQRGYSENMLSGELGRQGSVMESQLGRQQDSALAERSGARSMTNAMLDRNLQATTGHLNRGLGMIPYLGMLRGNEFADHDRRLAIGKELDQHDRANQDIQFENDARRFQYREGIFDRLQNALAPMQQTEAFERGRGSDWAGANDWMDWIGGIVGGAEGLGGLLGSIFGD